MLNCTLTVEPVSKMNGCPIFVGVATGPAIAGNDADAMEDFAVYCYKGKGDGAWRFTFDPQDMPKVSSLAPSHTVPNPETTDSWALLLLYLSVSY